MVVTSAIAAPRPVVRAQAVVRAQVCPIPPRITVLSPLKRLGQAAAGVSAAFLLAAAPALASPDLALGEEVFSGNCAACHSGGGNSVQPNRTLAKADLEAFLDGGYNEAAIIYQVTNGKNAMPAWGDRLSEEEIESVAAYVLKASADGW